MIPDLICVNVDHDSRGSTESITTFGANATLSHLVAVVLRSERWIIFFVHAVRRASGELCL